jgi:hypothetical protein
MQRGLMGWVGLTHLTVYGQRPAPDGKRAARPRNKWNRRSILCIEIGIKMTVVPTYEAFGAMSGT